MVIGETVWADDCTKIRQLPEERVGSRHCCNRHQFGPSERVEWKCLTGRRAVQLRRREMNDRDWNLGRGSGDSASRVGYCRCARCLACYHHETCAARGAERLSPRPCRKKARRSRPRVGIDQHDVGVSGGASMLKRIVEDDHVDTLRNRFPNASPAIRRFNDGHTRIEPFVHQSFITAVATQNYSGFCALLREAARYPGRHRRLSSAADGEIAYAEHRCREIFRSEQALVV